MNHPASKTRLPSNSSLKVWQPDDQNTGLVASKHMTTKRSGWRYVGHWTFEVTHYGIVLIPESKLHTVEEPKCVPSTQDFYSRDPYQSFRYKDRQSWNPIHLSYLVGDDRSSVGYMLKEDMEEFMGIHDCNGHLTYRVGNDIPERTWLLENIIPASIDFNVSDDDSYVLNLSLLFTSANMTTFQP